MPDDSVFPGALDTIKDDETDDTKQITEHPSHHNKLAKAVKAIQSTLHIGWGGFGTGKVPVAQADGSVAWDVIPGTPGPQGVQGVAGKDGEIWFPYGPPNATDAAILNDIYRAMPLGTNLTILGAHASLVTASSALNRYDVEYCANLNAVPQVWSSVFTAGNEVRINGNSVYGASGAVNTPNVVAGGGLRIKVLEALASGGTLTVRSVASRGSGASGTASQNVPFPGDVANLDTMLFLVESTQSAITWPSGILDLVNPTTQVGTPYAQNTTAGHTHYFYAGRKTFNTGDVETSFPITQTSAPMVIVTYAFQNGTINFAASGSSVVDSSTTSYQTPSGLSTAVVNTVLVHVATTRTNASSGTPSIIATTTATGVNAAGSAIMNVGDNTLFPASGVFILGGVVSTYTGKSGTTQLTGCQSNHGSTVGGEAVTSGPVWDFPAANSIYSKFIETARVSAANIGIITGHETKAAAGAITQRTASFTNGAFRNGATILVEPGASAPLGPLVVVRTSKP